MSEESGFPPKGYTIGIVGLGLMGGSLAAAVRHAWPQARVLGVSRRAETVERAAALGWIEDGSVEASDVLPKVQLAVLATPVRTIVDQLPEVGRLLPEGAYLTDLGSTKAEVVAAMERTERPGACVGGHPMCGKERHGLEAADPDLYRGATWVLCPGRATASETVQVVAGLARAVGARPLILDAAGHDAIVARTSHLPYLTAAALARTVGESVTDGDLRTLSAGGYRDTTRLAASEVNMMLDIVLTNRTNVLAAVRALQAQLAEVERALAQADERGLAAYLEQARRSRRIT